MKSEGMMLIIGVTLCMFIWIYRNYIYFITGFIVTGSKLQLITLLP